MWNQAVLERLNNAIILAARVAGPGSPAWELNQDWADWWEDSTWRSLGMIGVPFVAGTAEGFWKRYSQNYRQFSAAERANLPTPRAVAPTKGRLVEDAARQTLADNAHVAREASKAAQQGAAMAVDQVRAAADAVESRATRATWLVLIPIGVLALILLREVRR